MEESVFCIDTSYSGIQREAIKELERVARGYEAELIISGNVLSTGKTERLVLNGYKK